MIPETYSSFSDSLLNDNVVSFIHLQCVPPRKNDFAISLVALVLMMPPWVLVSFLSTNNPTLLLLGLWNMTYRWMQFLFNNSLRSRICSTQQQFPGCSSFSTILFVHESVRLHNSSLVVSCLHRGNVEQCWLESLPMLSHWSPSLKDSVIHLMNNHRPRRPPTDPRGCYRL